MRSISKKTIFITTLLLSFMIMSTIALTEAEAQTGAQCAPLTETIGDVITVSDVSGLKSALSTLKNQGGNGTILLNDGIYELDEGLWINAPNIMFRSVSGDRDKVIIKGNGMDGSVPNIFWVAADNITIADMSIGEVSNHPIQVHGELDADNVFVHNVRIYNGREQLLKGAGAGTGNYSDNGVVECSLFEFSEGQAYQAYTGGIDVHHGKNWIIRDNVFKNIRSPGGGLAEHAIHFWSDSEGTIVERNKIINCDRGIGFGLGERGHKGGIIRNNMLYNDGTGMFNDVGIGLESADGVKVYNNTIYHEQVYPNAIEYRFPATNADIFNNLVNKAIIQRNNGNANLGNNMSNAQKNWFVDPEAGDLHLKLKISEVIDQGTGLNDVTEDFDKEIRPQGLGYDIGADEADESTLKTLLDLSLSVSKTEIVANGTDAAVLTVLAKYDDGTDEEIRPENFVRTNSAGETVSIPGSVFTTYTPDSYTIQVFSGSVASNEILIVAKEEDLSGLQVSDLNVRHEAGQTFLSWREINNIINQEEITYEEFFEIAANYSRDIRYRIYYAHQRITSVSDMTPLTEVGPLSCWNREFYGKDTRTRYAKKKAIRYVIEDGHDPVPAGTGIHVHNPDQAGAGYYAVTVVVDGQENIILMSGQNATEVPIQETVGQGKPVLQRVAYPDSFQYIANPTLYYYTRWEAPPNASIEGKPFDYLVAIPSNLADPAPVGIHLHSWGANLEGGYGWWNDAEDGAILLSSNQFPYDWWTGYHESIWTDKPLKTEEDWQSGVVKPYSTTRMLSFLDWMKEESEWNIDSTRTFTAGSSMGGSGSLMFAIRYPDNIAWSRSWVGVHIPAKSPTFASSYKGVYGDEQYGVLFEDGTPVWDYYNDAWYLRQYPEKEIGFMTFSNGKNDGAIGWGQAVEFYQALQETKRPHLFMWGQAGHGQRTVMPGNGSERVMPIDIRVDQTLPAFTRCSLDDNPGNGDPVDGDAEGQINRYMYWETEDIIDELNFWAMTVGITVDAPEQTASVDLTPRRVQKFKPESGEIVQYTNKNAATGEIVESGQVQVDENGLITLEQITVTQDKNRIEIHRETILISKEQQLEFNRGGEPSLPFVHRGDTISYSIIATNDFNETVTLLISDALSALVYYITGTLAINGNTVSKDLSYFDGNLLEYESEPLPIDQSLTISLDVMVKDDALHDAFIENSAMVTAYSLSSGIPIFSGEMSNVVQAQVKNSVPEPSTFIFLGTGLLGLFALIRKRGEKRE